MNFLYSIVFLILLGCVNVETSSSSLNSNDTIEKYGSEVNIIGSWEWEKNNVSKDFTLTIKKNGQKIEGSYCYVMQAGAKMDCINNGYNFEIEFFEGDTIETDFKSGFNGQIGNVRIVLLAKHSLLWEIMEEPKGEYYCPKRAIMNRRK